MSRTKYEATLLCLYDIDYDPDGLISVAKALRVSYGVLRKWRSEEGFKKQVETNEREFAEVFWQFALRYHQTQMKKWNAFRRAPLQKIATTPLPPSTMAKDLEPLSDGRHYRPSLLMAIMRKIDQVLETADSAAATSYVSIFAYLNPSPDRQKGLMKKASVIFAQTLMDRIEKLVCKPRLSDDEKKDILVSLKALRLGWDEE